MKNGRQTAGDADDDFRLADELMNMSDEDLERMAEQDAENEVSSSAYEGIPLDKATLRAGLLAAYQRMRAERTAGREAPTRFL